jgi:hypothetical protein
MTATTVERPGGLASVFVQPNAGGEYGHDCQLSAENNIRTCDDPNHGRDAAALRDALVMVGILPDPTADGRRKRGLDGKTLPARGRCSGCGTRKDLMLDGRVRAHKVNEEDCSGQHLLPVQEQEAAA